MDNKEKITKKTENIKNTDKKNNANNSKTIIIILSSVIAVCLIVIIVLLCLLLKKSDDNKSSDNKSAVSDTTAQSETSASADNTLTVGAPDADREAIEIVTKYGTLFYPKEWESNLRTEIIDEDVYKVEFYGHVEGKEEYQLFDLIFNGTEGYNLGTLTTESGATVEINIESYDFEFDDTWTDDEKNVICAMQEDINYIIGMLSESGSFTLPN